MAGEGVVRVAARPVPMQACAHVLADAFADDPLMSSIWPDRSRRAVALRTYFTATLSHEHSVVGVVEFVAVEGRPVAVAAWDGPNRGSALAGLWRTLRAAPELLSALRTRLPVGVDVRRRLDEHEPGSPHWTLVNLGVHPDHQGSGLARTLLNHRLAAIDADAAASHLVCTRAKNVSLYERFGFTTTKEFGLRDGTPLWAMDRRWRALCDAPPRYPA
ncbi:GNAT family N-acetyltransferase [uncultured Williamsia sp.]|uniref:GNAT family N-acetyltransferase n=1 Tax=uncultured Williamsia sp. TaxID=259311 RepID=UPI002623BC61|nr:GNAT family N-acetyltransferase [uncultured Williamsia sp.]